MPWIARVGFFSFHPPHKSNIPPFGQMNAHLVQASIFGTRLELSLQVRRDVPWSPAVSPLTPAYINQTPFRLV